MRVPVSDHRPHTLASKRKLAEIRLVFPNLGCKTLTHPWYVLKEVQGDGGQNRRVAAVKAYAVRNDAL